MSRTRFIRLSPMRIPPSTGRAPPESPVPAPLATKGIRSRWQTFTTPATCSAERGRTTMSGMALRSEEHTSELQSLRHLVCRLLLEKKNKTQDDVRLAFTEAPDE